MKASRLEIPRNIPPENIAFFPFAYVQSDDALRMYSCQKETSSDIDIYTGFCVLVCVCVCACGRAHSCARVCVCVCGMCVYNCI